MRLMAGDFNPNDIDSLKSIDHSLAFTATGPDPFIHSPQVRISASKTPYITVIMSIQGCVLSRSSMAIYFITKNDDRWGDDKNQNYPLSTGNTFKTYVIYMSGVSTWQGEITQFRLDPIDQPDPLICDAHIAINEISVTQHAP